MSRPTVEQLARGLRAWTRHHDPHVRAAVELLISHDVWLHRSEFVRPFVRRSSDGSYWIDWDAAREAFDAGELRCASTTEVAVLDFAIALGCDRFRFSQMGGPNTRLLLEATGQALEMTR